MLVRSSEDTEDEDTEVGTYDTPLFTDPSECRQAIESLGLEADEPYQGEAFDIPRFCSVAATAGVGAHRMHFNTATMGQGRGDLAPVCDSGYSFLALGLCTDKDGQLPSSLTCQPLEVRDCMKNCDSLPGCLGTSYQRQLKRCRMWTAAPPSNQFIGTTYCTAQIGASAGPLAISTGVDDWDCYIKQDPR